MNKSIISALFLSLSLFVFTGCSSNEPLSDTEIAEKYNMSDEELQEMKEAAARMNMSIDEHMKMME